MRSAHPHQARRSARCLVSAATIGCVSGAALVLALAACSTSSSSPAAAVRHPAGAAAPSAANCTVDCVTPVASTDAQWYAQVSGALGQVHQDLVSIQADAGTPNLTVDGAQLAQDAQAALNTEIDPAPVDNADFVAAMNDYIGAGNDYAGTNDSGTQDVSQAAQEVSAGNAAVRSFNAAQASAPAAFTPGSGFTSCGSGVYAGPHTSCPFALNVYQAATADGNTPIITAYSPTTGKSYSVALTSTNPVTYNGASNGNTALIEWAATNAAAPSAAPATTAPATAAAVPMPVPGSAPKVTVWCGSTYAAFSSPSLTVWKKTAEYGYNDAFVSIIPGLKRQAAYMESPSSPAATVVAGTQSMCLGVISAFDNPPPVDLAQYKAAMDDFAQGAYVIHSGAIANDYGPSVGTAGKYFNSAIAELNAFLAAVGP